MYCGGYCFRCYFFRSELSFSELSFLDLIAQLSLTIASIKRVHAFKNSNKFFIYITPFYLPLGRKRVKEANRHAHFVIITFDSTSLIPSFF